MPLTSDLSSAPYLDDDDESKDFYKVLFVPGVSVQTRELNQLQTLLQRQIERFGDNILTEGTIVDGCSIKLYDYFPYVKINDNQTDGSPVNVTGYINYRVKSPASNLQALVISSVNGFESRDPDLNTLYVKYLNSGDSGNTYSFSADEVLEVYDPSLPVEKINILNGSSGFANTDKIIVMSSLAVQNTAGGKTLPASFANGSYIDTGAAGANLQIVGVDAVSNAQSVILKVKPLLSDLAVANTLKWSVNSNTTVRVTANATSVANIVGLVGSGATATLVTDSVGRISTVAITNKGSEYFDIPTVSVASKTANTSQIATSDFAAQLYLARSTVANTATTPTGSGYAVYVGQGIIYQKGYFSRVSPQVVIVDKYTNTPSDKAIGFVTNETIINSNIDTSLLDNALGEPNFSAPGADRLKLDPRITVVDANTVSQDPNFLSIIEFNDGKPYIQNRQTDYNIIGKEMEKRTMEESGNYVIDPFVVGSISTKDFSNEANSFNVVIDAGTAYINGKRVETTNNYIKMLSKATSIATTNNATISLSYGNYIKVNQMGGQFSFNTGSLVTLYNAPKNYYANTSLIGTTNTQPSATAIGTARVRSVIKENGISGTAEAIYRVYLFDINMDPGMSINNCGSLYYNDANTALTGVADLTDRILYDSGQTALTYKVATPAIAAINGMSYVSRTTATANVSTNGTIVITSGTNKTFPYVGDLSISDLNDISVVPLATVHSANISGSIALTTGSANVVGTGTAFTTQIAVGDYIGFSNSSSANIAYSQVATVANDTFFTTTANSAVTNTSANAYIKFHQKVPVNLVRTGRKVSVAGNTTQMTVNFGTAITANTPVSIAYNVNVNIAPGAEVQKTVLRDAFVRIKVANNAAGIIGPWALGVSDVFRLKAVYKGSNTTFVANSTGVQDVTSHFYADHNQREDYYDTSYLYKKSNSPLAITSGDVFLIKYDSFITGTEGLKSVESYPINDATPLANAVNTINTVEIPEMYGTKGEYYDLRDCIDLRPITANTIVQTQNAASAPINPTVPSPSLRFSTDDKNFPAPVSTLVANVSYYLPRVDKVIVDPNGQLRVITGVPGSLVAPAEPASSLTISDVTVPAYPSLPQDLSSAMQEYINTNIANETFANKRTSLYTIKTASSATEIALLQPRGYTMKDIGDLDRRLGKLEVLMALTLAELEAQKRNIPSTNTPSIERFKFGFFVDDCNDYTYAEKDSPNYLATISDGFLIPTNQESLVKLRPDTSDANTKNRVVGNLILPAYTEFAAISQLMSTNGPVPAPVWYYDDTPVYTPTPTPAPVQTPQPVPTAQENFNITTNFNNETGKIVLSVSGTVAGSAQAVYDSMGREIPGAVVVVDSNGRGTVEFTNPTGSTAHGYGMYTGGYSVGPPGLGGQPSW